MKLKFFAVAMPLALMLSACDKQEDKFAGFTAVGTDKKAAKFYLDTNTVKRNRSGWVSFNMVRDLTDGYVIQNAETNCDNRFFTLEGVKYRQDGTSQEKFAAETITLPSDNDNADVTALVTMACDKAEEKRGSVSKLFVRPQQPQQPQRPQQPQQPQQRPQQRPQQPQQRPQQPKEPILDQLTEEITEKIKNKKDTAKQNLIEGTKNAKEGVASFITGLSANGKIGNVQDAKEGVTNIMKGFTDKMPGIENAKENFANLAKGNLGDASSIIDGFKSKIPGIKNAKENFTNLAKGKLGDASSIMKNMSGKTPDLVDLAKGKFGDASSIMKNMSGKTPDLANAKDKFANLAKGKFKGLIP